MVLKYKLTLEDRDQLVEYLNFVFEIANSRGGSRNLESEFEQLWEVVVELDKLWTKEDEKNLINICQKIDTIIRFPNYLNHNMENGSGPPNSPR